MKSLLRIIIILVLGLTLTQCNTPAMQVFLPGIYSSMKHNSTIKLSANNDLSKDSLILMNGYYIPDDSSSIQFWFFPDGSSTVTHNFNPPDYPSRWYVYEFKDSAIISNCYTPIFKHLYEVSPTSDIYIESDSVLYYYTDTYDWVSRTYYTTKTTLRFVPTDTVIHATFPLSRHRWMWKNGVMPKDTTDQTQRKKSGYCNNSTDMTSPNTF